MCNASIHSALQHYYTIMSNTIQHTTKVPPSSLHAYQSPLTDNSGKPSVKVASLSILIMDAVRSFDTSINSH
jgi:hypothetical protein